MRYWIAGAAALLAACSQQPVGVVHKGEQVFARNGAVNYRNQNYQSFSAEEPAIQAAPYSNVGASDLAPPPGAVSSGELPPPSDSYQSSSNAQPAPNADLPPNMPFQVVSRAEMQLAQREIGVTSGPGVEFDAYEQEMAGKEPVTVPIEPDPLPEQLPELGSVQLPPEPQQADEPVMAEAAPVAPYQPEQQAQPEPQLQPGQYHGEIALEGQGDVSEEPVQTIEPPVQTAPAAVTASQRFIWPLQGTIISAFGQKDGGLANDGINIEAVEGTPVRAVANSTVVYAGNELKGYGNMIILRHPDGWMSAYAHLRDIGVQLGDPVNQGELIGQVGKTGHVTVPQLHFSLREGKQAVDPMGYLPQNVATR